VAARGFRIGVVLLITITYRPPDLGSLVHPPKFNLWTPPPTLTASQDPYLMKRMYVGIQRIGGFITALPRQETPAARKYGGGMPDTRS
jgi:hypothetical protein